MTQFYRDTYAEISLRTIEKNIQTILAGLPAHVKMMATVKANAYGHGAYPVAQTALKAGADFLSVALLDEAVALRKQGIYAPILILGPIHPEQIAIAAESDIHMISRTISLIERSA